MLRTEINKWKHWFVVLKKVDLSIITTVNGFELKNKTQLPNNQNYDKARKELDSNTENWIHEPNILKICELVFTYLFGGLRQLPKSLEASMENRNKKHIKNPFQTCRMLVCQLCIYVLRFLKLSVYNFGSISWLL